MDDSLLADATTRKAFEILAGRFADAATGLTNIEARLLRAAPTEWRKMARVIADALVEGYDDGDMVGDLVLQGALQGMARADPPLVEIEGESGMLHCKVRLTPEGRRRKVMR